MINCRIKKKDMGKNHFSFTIPVKPRTRRYGIFDGPDMRKRFNIFSRVFVQREPLELIIILKKDFPLIDIEGNTTGLRLWIALEE